MRSLNAQLFQKLQEINPKKDLTIIVRAGASATPLADLIRPYFKRYQGVNIVCTGRAVSSKVQQTLERRAKELGSEFYLEAPHSKASQEGLGGLIAALSRCHTEYFVLTDAVELHPIELIDDLIRELDYGADLAVCSRVHSSAFERGLSFMLRQVRSSFARFYLSRSSIPVRDPYSSYFAGRTSRVLEAVKKTENLAGGKNGQTLVELLALFGASGRIAEVNYLTPITTTVSQSVKDLV